MVLLNHQTGDVLNALIEFAGLLMIQQIGGVLRDSMSKLMADVIQRLGEVVEHDTISITKNHLLSGPNCIVKTRRVLVFIMMNAAKNIIPRLSLESRMNTLC